MVATGVVASVAEGKAWKAELVGLQLVRMHDSSRTMMNGLKEAPRRSVGRACAQVK